MHQNCPVCDGRDFNREGIQLAEKEIIPFIKREVLKLRYPTHPFPLKYDGLLSSVMCYSQAVAYARAHNAKSDIYYTSNKWMLKYGLVISSKFGIAIADTTVMIKHDGEACQFNAKLLKQEN